MQNFENYDIFYVNVNCDLSLLEKREKESGNRFLGQTRFQYFKINTNKNSPLDSAKLILENYLGKNLS